MKKTLAILLSLALVICMIPATASVAFADTTVVVGEHTCSVQVTKNEVYYDNTDQEPEVVLSYIDESGVKQTVTKDNG